MRRRVAFILVWILVSSLLIGCSPSKGTGDETEAPEPSAEDIQPVEETDPIEDMVTGMTLEEKLGQMLIGGLSGYEINDITRQMIEKHHIGGFIFYGANINSPKQLLAYVNSLKAVNKAYGIPLLMSVDEEGGRISRMPKELKKLPTAKAIGRIGKEDFSYQVGLLLAEKVKTFGFNMNFAPVLDINSNPKNPVIGDRAFGSQSDIVSRLGAAAMQGIREGGVIAVVKHFPGHGDTSVDSHIGLPSVDNDLERLRQFELIPFENAISSGAECVMAAHVLLPKLDQKNPATLSKRIITDLLRQQMGFEGVVITDDMTMGAISKNFELGEAAVKAVDAGCDIVLVAHGHENVYVVLEALKEAVSQGRISEERVNESVYRIIKLKKDYKLSDEEIAAADLSQINDKIDTVLKQYIK